MCAKCTMYEYVYCTQYIFICTVLHSRTGIGIILAASILQYIIHITIYLSLQVWRAPPPPHQTFILRPLYKHCAVSISVFPFLFLLSFHRSRGLSYGWLCTSVQSSSNGAEKCTVVYSYKYCLVL
jgi:hypothetical protein